MMNKLLAFLGVIYVLAVIFAPPMSGQGTELVRYDDIVLLLALTVVVLMRFKKQGNERLPFPFLGMISVGYILLFLILVSSMMSSFRIGELGNVSKEIVRMLKYGLVVFVFVNITSPIHQAWIRRTIVIAGLITAGLILFQYFGSTNANRTIADFYGGGIYFSYSVSMAKGREYFSGGGSFGNSNVAASFLLLPFGLILWRLLDISNTAMSRTRQRWLLAIIVTLVIGIVLTQSRTAIVSATGSFLVALFLSKRNHSLTIKQFVVTVFLFLLTLIVIQRFVINVPGIARLSEGFQQQGSYAIKMANLQEGTIQMIREGAIFGLGPGRGPQVDFEFGYYFIWYGLIGLISYIVMWVVILRPVWSNPRGFYNEKALIVIASGLIVSSLSQTNVLSVRIFPLFLALYCAEIKWGFWRKRQEQRTRIIRDATVAKLSSNRLIVKNSR